LSFLGFIFVASITSIQYKEVPTITYAYDLRKPFGPVSVGFGPTIGNHEIQKKVGFFYSENSKKNEEKVGFSHFYEICKNCKTAKKLGISKILKTSLFRLRNMC